MIDTPVSVTPNQPLSQAPINPNPPPQSPSLPQPVAIKKNKIMQLILVCLGIMAILVGGLGYCYWSKKQSNPDVIPYDRKTPPAEDDIILPSPLPPTATPATTVSTTSNGSQKYTNAKAGYSLTLPADWLIEETDTVGKQLTGDEAEFMSNVRYTKFSSPTGYNLFFGLKKSTETEVRLSSRTGVGAGEFVTGPQIQLGQYQQTSSMLEYQGKQKELFMPPQTSNATTAVPGYELNASFGYNGDQITNYEAVDLSQAPEFIQVKEILASFKLLSN